MRQIGHIDSDKDARTFGDFLYVEGIPTEIDRDEERWAIWVHDDDHIPKAKKLLDEFRADPSASRWQAGSPAEKLREQAQAAEVAYRKRIITGANIFPGLANYGFGLVTYLLIVVCVVIAIATHGGDDVLRISGLFIERLIGHGSDVWAERDLAAVRAWQLWRLVTPIFIHFGLAHIIFNMLMLRDLGSLFEARLGSWYFVLFVVVVAVVSNLAQYLIAKNPFFGGMSGVICGLIGYVWIRSRLDPAAGVVMHRQQIVYALIWFALCFTGLVGPIANWAHAGGLVAGMLWAFIDSKRKTT